MKRHGIPDYDRKFAFLWTKQSGKCAVSGKQLGGNHRVELHHVIANDKPNRKLYPHYLHSVWNLVAVNQGPHDTEPLPKKPPYYEVAQAEDILVQMPGAQWKMTMAEALKAGMMI